MHKLFLVFRVRPSWQVSSSVSSFPSVLWTASKGHGIKKKSVTVSCKFLCGGNGACKLREFENHGSVLWNFWTCHGVAVSGVREKNIHTLQTGESNLEREAMAKAGHAPWAALHSSLGVYLWNWQTIPILQRRHKLAAFSSLMEEVGPE